MASITRESNGRRTIQFVASNKRKSIRLGKVSQHIAESIKIHVEKLIAAKVARHVVEAPTQQWLNEVDRAIYDRLAAVDLVPRRKTEAETLLGPFLDSYIQSRRDVKPATLEVWAQPVRNLKDHFGPDREVASISESDAESFKAYLVSLGLASTTVSKRLQFARTFFHVAVKRRVIPENPFLNVRSIAVIPKDRQRYVSVEEIERVIEVADPTWRTILALARFAGLRCPSEVLSLRWQDVDWQRNRIEVQSPKTERHAGKESRTIPIFAALRPYLEDAFELRAKDAVYVIGGNYREMANTSEGWRNMNLRSHFLRLLERVGLKPWPRPFHNLRSSCETDLAQEFPMHTVTAWLGNSPKIALKHYLQVRDQDFQQASRGGAESGAFAVQKAVQQPAAANRNEVQKRHKPLTDQGLMPNLATPRVLTREAYAERAGNHEASRRNHRPRVANDCRQTTFVR